MNLRSELTLLRENINEMEVIAWSAMEYETLVETLAQNAWKRYHDTPGEGRVGFSKGKIRLYVNYYAKGYSRKKRNKLVQDVTKRAQKIFDDHCMDWASEVTNACNVRFRRWPPRRADLKQVITEIVPRGARKEVEDHIGRSLNWQ